jgi:hypothetical protein
VTQSESVLAIEVGVVVPTCKDGAVAWSGTKNAELSEGGTGLQHIYAGAIDWQGFIRMRRR